MRFSLSSGAALLLATASLTCAVPTPKSKLSAEDMVNIRDTISEYAFTVDSQALDGLANVFTADVKYALPGAVLNGIDAVKGAFGAALRGKKSQHAMSSTTINSNAPNTATSKSYFTATFFGVEPDAAVAHGVYDDKWVKDQMNWLISERTLTYIVRRTAPLTVPPRERLTKLLSYRV